MKTKILAVILLIAILICGCSNKHSAEGSQQFYYLQNTTDCSLGSTIISPEYRHVEGTLADQLEVYLNGPTSSDLVSPFPDGTKLISIQFGNNKAEILLSQEFSQLGGIELSLACASLAKTCFTLTQATELEIRAEKSLLDGTECITLTPTSLLLTDNSIDK